MKNLFIGLLLIVSSLASANNLPTKLEGVAFPLPAYEASPKQKEEIYQNLYKAIEKVAYGNVLLPDTLSLYTVKSYNNAYYFPYAGAIVTPYQLIIEGASKHPKFTRGVELHEFAHSIFEANILTILKDNAEFLKIAKDYLEVRSLFKQEALEMLGFMVANDLAVETPDEERMSTEYANAEAKFNQAGQEQGEVLENYMSLAEGLSPLNEFFSDVFAVVITNDPEVIRKAIEYTAHADAKQTDRSFSIRPGKRDTKFVFSPHNFYSLSRYYIYRNYLSNAEVRLKGPRWIMTRVVDSARCAVDSQKKREKELNEGYEKTKNEEQYLIETYNRFLNDCIDTAFKK